MITILYVRVFLSYLHIAPATVKQAKEILKWEHGPTRYRESKRHKSNNFILEVLKKNFCHSDKSALQLKLENLWKCTDCGGIVKNTSNNISQHKSTQMHLRALNAKQSSRKGPRKQKTTKKKSKVKKVRKRT